MTPPRAGLNSPDHDQAPSLGEALAAYFALLDEIPTETQYHLLGKRENVEKVAYLGDIVARASARAREQQRGT